MYCARVDRAQAIAPPDPDTYHDNVRMAVKAYRTAAELEEHPSHRMPWYEACVRACKECERYTLLRVQSGALNSEQFHLACFERFQTEIDLLALQAEIAAAGPAPRGAAPRTELGPIPIDSTGQPTEPTFTAFPQLKAPTVRLERTPEGTKAIDEGRVPHPNLVVIGPDASPLLRAQHERANAGVAHIKRVEAGLAFGGPDPNEFNSNLTFAVQVFHAAAQLEPQLLDRVPWYEACVRTMKELEDYTTSRVAAGALQPQRADSIQFQRLSAEADLLTLLASIATLRPSAPAPSVKREPFAVDQLKPLPEPDTYTAFPEFKPVPQFPGDLSGEKRLAALLAGAKAPIATPGETPLRQLQREQTLCGLAYIAYAEGKMALYGPDPRTFSTEQAMTAEILRVAAKQEPQATNRIAWHEARIRALKEGERYAELRVRAMAIKPQMLDQARFNRLGAEIDLLLLKAGPAPAAPATTPTAAPALCPPPCICVPQCGPRVRARCGLLNRVLLRR